MDYKRKALIQALFHIVMLGRHRTGLSPKTIVAMWTTSGSSARKAHIPFGEPAGGSGEWRPLYEVSSAGPSLLQRL